MTRTGLLMVASAGMAIALSAVGFSHAQQRGAAPGGAPGARGGRGGGDAVQAARQLKPNLYLITGAGANTAVRVTPEGLIVVDTKNPGDENYAALAEQIKAVGGGQAVKYVLNAHHHPDHVGNNQKFLDAGATILGLESLKSFMTSDPRTAQIPGRPTMTFAKDYTLRLGGAEVQAHFYGRAHTGDDTVIYFPDLKIVMIGDTVTDTNPVVDVANGGGLVEWGQVLESVLKLDFELAVPGRGEPRPKADVLAFKTKIDTVVKRAADAIKAGAGKDQLMGQVKMDDIGFTLQKNVFDNLYDELTKR